jgi:hypothetical protein
LTNKTLASSTNVIEATYGPSGTQFGFRNKIHNGAMNVDQRNAGAAKTIAANSSGFVLDRHRCDASINTAITAQQVADAPDGFYNSLKYTVGTAGAAAAGDFAEILLTIEGYDVAHMKFGTAAAKPFSLSFWVKSSIAGTYGVVFENNAANRSYATTYVINSANTWEKKTFQNIPGDITGTWDYAAQRGIAIRLDLGFGSTYNQAATNAWTTTTTKYGVTGVVKLTGTTGATYNITGIQFEEGPICTAFEHRPYQVELALCQRYCWVLRSSGTASLISMAWLPVSSTSPAIGVVHPPVPVRTVPTSLSASSTGHINYSNGGGYTSTNIALGSTVSTTAFSINVTISGPTGAYPGWIYFNNASAWISFEGADL